MPTIAIATLQTIWDCRWSRPARALFAVDDCKTDALWICVRPTATVVRRPVTEEECEKCPHGELNASIED